MEAKRNGARVTHKLKVFTFQQYQQRSVCAVENIRRDARIRAPVLGVVGCFGIKLSKGGAMFESDKKLDRQAVLSIRRSSISQ